MKKVALITFEDQAKTYEALSQLKQISKSNTLELKQAAILQKSEDGTSYVIKDGLDYESGNRIATGGIIGMVVGILGGPLGVLCGWVVGDLAGLGTNYIKNKKTNTIFDSVAKELTQNELGLLLYMDETDTALLDTMIVDKLNGTIERFGYDSVQEDLETAKKHLN
ncbi:hypothetical protein ACYSNW_10120 [Enterococcus sp. LJL99]